MKVTETISSAPIGTDKSVRGEEIRCLTSGRAGKILPLAFAPLLREDRVASGKVAVRLQMAETIFPLMNAVNVTVMAHFIPFSAFERFTGMDAFNRSYQGIGEPHNGTPIPFFTTVTFNKNLEFWKTLGLHWPHGTPINGAVLEAYNLLVNWRRKARSVKLPVRAMNDTTLAAAFWRNPNLWHIVPDFDQAMIDGDVELKFASNSIPVKGIGFAAANVPPTANITVNETGLTRTGDYSAPGNTNANPVVRKDPANANSAHVFVELANQGIRVSLANIELAKKTAAFARMREQYSGLSDDHLIDLLMEGIRVPDEDLRQPILLDKKSTIFGYTERFATDGANLDQSVTTGQAIVNLTLRTPPMNSGGIILITAEIVPEQLFERMEDNFMAITDPAKLPNFLRDYLDPEKVEVVPNKMVDVLHATPTGTFGYAPLNHRWKRSLARIGGRYMRPEGSSFVEDRQRFWAVEQANPALTTDFYLVNNLPHTVFADSAADPFEILTQGGLQIVGNTVFGQMLSEDQDLYQQVDIEVDKTRIVQP